MKKKKNKGCVYCHWYIAWGKCAHKEHERCWSGPLKDYLFLGEIHSFNLHRDCINFDEKIGFLRRIFGK